MGLGGHLLWSSVVRRLYEESGRTVRVCCLPGPSDLLRGRLHDAGRSLERDTIFRHNPRIDWQPAGKKSRLAGTIDRLIISALRRTGLLWVYERLVFRLARRARQQDGIWYAHIDMQLHSYVQRETRARLIWKSGGHIIDIILANYGLVARDHECELYFVPDEERCVASLREALDLNADFAVVEPHSSERWYGDLRTWPFDRWQCVIDWLRERKLPVVQIGEGGKRILAGAVDMTGHVSFREAVLLMKKARLFLGQEGGLMHAANAVDVPSVIVWGGIALPEFAAYRKHTVLCTYVDCAPCGLRGDCPYQKKCLTTVGTERVVSAAAQVLARAHRTRLAE